MSTNQPHPWIERLDTVLMLVAATRYYASRSTIGAGIWAQDLARAWPHLPDRARTLIKRDLEWEFDRDDTAHQYGGKFPPEIGPSFNWMAWEQVRSAWLKEEAKE